MSEKATVRDEALRKMLFLLFLDKFVPEAIIVIIVVDRYLMLVGDVISGLDVF